ncbi:MAG TPA: hypothetical protein VE974_05740 [Thermoanaerobaculia bacterium]|nr:hypothetical protein [Thermoanaerobaculia bacterium]
MRFDIYVNYRGTCEPFANRFAMLRDRFGTSWMLLHQPDSAEAG